MAHSVLMSRALPDDAPLCPLGGVASFIFSAPHRPPISPGRTRGGGKGADSLLLLEQVSGTDGRQRGWQVSPPPPMWTRVVVTKEAPESSSPNSKHAEPPSPARLGVSP